MFTERTYVGRHTRRKVREILTASKENKSPCMSHPSSMSMPDDPTCMWMWHLSLCKIKANPHRNPSFTGSLWTAYASSILAQENLWDESLNSSLVGWKFPFVSARIQLLITVTHFFGIFLISALGCNFWDTCFPLSLLCHALQGTWDWLGSGQDADLPDVNRRVD